MRQGNENSGDCGAQIAAGGRIKNGTHLSGRPWKLAARQVRAGT